MKTYQKNTSLIVLQATSFCNIACKYCYLPDRDVKNIISPELLENTIRKLLQSNMLSEHTKFLWHSGEPLVAGINFFEKVVELINKYNINQINVTHGIQTNATLIDQAWCDLFKKYNFEVGISLDGPDFLHDHNRVNRFGKGTHAKVMKGVSFLRSNKLKLAAISVLSTKSLEYPDELFNFFLENKFTSLSLLIEEIIGMNKNSSFTQAQTSMIPSETEIKYIKFIDRLFNLWLKNKDKITIREFMDVSNSIYNIKHNKNYEPKPIESQPLKVLTVQMNGDISTFCPELATGIETDRKRFCIGNIELLDQLEEITLNENFLKISHSIEKGINNCRQSCDYFKLCGSRTPGVKMYETNSFESTVTQHCQLHRQKLVDTVVDVLIKL